MMKSFFVKWYKIMIKYIECSSSSSSQCALYAPCVIYVFILLNNNRGVFIINKSTMLSMVLFATTID